MTDQETSAARKVVFKAKMLVEQIGLAAGLASTFAPRVRMVKAATRLGVPHRIMCEDGGWVEIDPTGRVVRTWGPGRTARDLAAGLKDRDDALAIEHLEPTAIAAAPGAPRRSSPVLTDQKAKSLADRWRARGFDDVTEDSRGVWIALKDGSRLYDVGNRVTVYGTVTDDAIVAMVAHTKAEWNGRHRLFGTWTDEERARMWLESMRQGVTLLEYEPSPELLARWGAEQAESARGADAALRPDDADLASASAGPVPLATDGGGATEAEPEASDKSAQADAGPALARNAERAQADLDALYERWAREARTEEDRERLRREEGALKVKLAIYERARELARARGLSREDAIRAAHAEARAERGYEPEAGLRR